MEDGARRLTRCTIIRSRDLRGCSTLEGDRDQLAVCCEKHGRRFGTRFLQSDASADAVIGKVTKLSIGKNQNTISLIQSNGLLAHRSHHQFSVTGKPLNILRFQAVQLTFAGDGNTTATLG